ncbi:hypothetical protein AURDEDRAFT_168879 [Auricularia subglabra TFB-10046 SS5]|nr:hypothetical protein AURDEDRAFT_168879 [Auricularia subglabra TFB-10046 SS5]
MSVPQSRQSAASSRDPDPWEVLQRGNNALGKTLAANHARPFAHNWGDVSIREARGLYLKAVTRGTLVTVVAILAILSIYWGAFWKVEEHIHNFHVAVVDLDQADVGRAVIAALASPNVTGSSKQLSYHVAPSGQFGSEEDVNKFVLDEHVWAAVVVSSGATARLNAALSTADGTYNASLTITALIVEARNENAVPVYIQPALERALQQFSVQYAAQRAPLVARAANLQAILTTTPGLVTLPASYTVRNLRPFDVPVAAAVDFVGLIYLLIISFLLALLNFNARVQSRLNTLLKLRQLIVLRLAAPLAMYFFVSWVYSFISLAFQVPFSRYYGRAGFVIYWAMSFVGMSALGLAIEALVTVLTPRFIPYFLILWIISNVSVAFYPIELLPGVYKYGYASPFYNVSLTVRALLFGTRNYIGLNFGVMFAWVSISCAMLPLLTAYVRNGEKREFRKKLQGYGKEL